MKKCEAVRGLVGRGIGGLRTILLEWALREVRLETKRVKIGCRDRENKRAEHINEFRLRWED